MDKQEVKNRISEFLAYVTSKLAGVKGLALIVTDDIEAKVLLQENKKLEEVATVIVKTEQDFLFATTKARPKKEQALVLITSPSFMLNTKIDLSAFDGVLYI